MSKVNFYALSRSEPEARSAFACRVIEKAVSLGHRVHVHCSDEEACASFDELLWQFRPEAFVPHYRLDASGLDESCPVSLACTPPPARANDVLVNLSDEFCEFQGQFQRLNEFVLADQASLVVGRERYRRYQQLGYSIEHHKIARA